MNISVYNFKNYYNRSGKGYLALSSYDSAAMLLGRWQEIQFNPNDGVTTELILDYADNLDPDYLIVSSEEDDAIVSRWYVMECQRTRSTQYRVRLKRDVIVDYKDVIRTASAFIERGYLSDDDPGIYNSEPITLNQIKSNEIPLPDNTNCNWIVGYFSASNEIDGETLIEDVYGDYALSGVTILPSMSDWEFYGYVGAPAGIVQKINNFNLTYKIQYGPLLYEFFEFTPLINEDWTKTSNLAMSSRFSLGDMGEPDIIGITLYNRYIPLVNGAQNVVKSWLESSLNVNSSVNYTKLKNENNKIYYDTTENKYYKVRVVVSNSVTIESRLTGGVLYGSTAYSNAVNIMNEMPGVEDNNTYGNEVSYTGTMTVYRVYLDDYTAKVTSTKISDDRRLLIDAPYSMFCIPYKTLGGEGKYIYKDGSFIQSNPSESLNIAQKIAEQYSGAGWLYDIQILPYYPGSQDFVNEYGDIDISGGTIDKDYNWIKDANNNNIGIIIWCSYSVRRFNIDAFPPGSDMQLPLQPIDGPKVSNCCDVYRLVAPNYNSSFEFSVAKNAGVEYFEVEYEYKPHNPYIHINPFFKNLYGTDYDDARGLICTGDYSISIVSNAWTTYQLQNINYQKIFDRQIENMDVNHTFDLINSIAGAVGGSSSGAIQGAMAGAKGGPYAAIAGGIVGGVMGAAGGIADVIMGEARYAESKDFAQDMFAYNLQNVRALPNTLAKVSALTPTNKQFPFIEIYKPTNLERQLFVNYINLKGMNVGRVDTIANYMIDDKYLKAQIIRMPDIKGDTHISQAIASEIDKGVYW